MRNWNRLRIARAAAALLLGISFLMLFRWTAAIAEDDAVPESEHNCGDAAFVASSSSTVGSSLGPMASPANAISLTPDKELEVRIRFLRDRGYRTSEDFILKYNSGAPPDAEVFPAGSLVAVDLSVFKRDSDSHELRPADHVVYSAQATWQGVNVRFCFDADGVPPGRYQSAATLADPKLQHSPVPMVVTVQEDNIGLMVGFAILPGLAGTAVLFLQSWFLAESRGAPPLPLLGRRGWLVRNIMTIGFGVAAVWAVWNGQYFENEAFGAQGTQYLAFVIACGTAFTGAAVAGSLATEAGFAFSGRGVPADAEASAEADNAQAGTDGASGDE